ncbi:MAG: hypothetical protein JO040_02655 [Gemmatimonadetes bacterium]|nr:hypothetical protein [Gemmatimonadota bacterium]
MLGGCLAAGVVTGAAALVAPGPRGRSLVPRTAATLIREAPPRDTTVAQIDLRDGRLYRDPRSGFHIEFPDGWELQQAEEEGVVKAVRGDATIAVMVRDATTPEMLAEARADFLRRGIHLSDQEAMEAVRRELDFGSFDRDALTRFVGRRLEGIRAAARGSTVQEQGIRRLGRWPAGYIRATSDGGSAPGEKITNVLYFTLYHGRYYHVAAGALTARYDSLAPLLQKSIRSFAIEEK